MPRQSFIAELLKHLFLKIFKSNAIWFSLITTLQNQKDGTDGDNMRENKITNKELEKIHSQVRFPVRPLIPGHFCPLISAKTIYFPYESARVRISWNKNDSVLWFQRNFDLDWTNICLEVCNV